MLWLAMALRVELIPQVQKRLQHGASRENPQTNPVRLQSTRHQQLPSRAQVSDPNSAAFSL
jgi:hypothetical protein